MMKTIVNKIWQKGKVYILSILLIAISAYAVIKSFESNDYQKQIAQYKDIIIKKDSLRKLDDGQYQKLIDDTKKSSRVLLDGLKAKNKDLSETIEEQDKKILLYANIISSFKPKTDTVYVDKVTKSFEDFYPNTDDWFIKYTSTYLGNDKRLGDWYFQQYPLDVVVSEISKGLFEIDLAGPDFLQVNSLQVNSLPLSPITVDNFGWIIGGDVNYNFDNHIPALGVYGGFRYKKTILFTRADTQKTVGVGLLKEF